MGRRGLEQRRQVQDGRTPYPRRWAPQALAAALLLGLAPAPAAGLIRVGGLDLDARDVVVRGRHAFVADFSFGLRVLDVSDPEVPVTVASLGLAGALSIAVENDLALVSFGLSFPPLVLDVSDPERPRGLAAIDDTQCWGRATLSGRIAYLGFSGLCILDLSRPDRPRKLAFLPRSTAMTDVEVAGGVAFVTTAFTTVLGGGSLELVDVSKPAAPVLLSSVRLSSEAYDVALAGDVAWVNQQDGVTSIDVSDPRAAAVIATTPLLRSLPQDRRMLVRGSLGYATASGEGLQVLDLSDPLAPRRLGSLDTKGHAQGIALAGELAFVASGRLAGAGGSLDVIDVSYPFAPVELSHLDTLAPARGLALANGFAYLASSEPNQPGFVEVLDVSDPAAPVRVGASELALPVSDVEVSGGTAFVTGHEFRTLDVSDPTDPLPLGRLANRSEALELVGSVVVTENHTIGVSDPAEPADLGSRGVADDVAVADGLVYTADADRGMRVTDVPISEIFATSRFGGICLEVDAGRAYLGDAGNSDAAGRGRGSLFLFDLWDLYGLDTFTTAAVPGAVHDIDASGARAYLAVRAPDSSGVAVLDVADFYGDLPTLGALATPGLPEDVETQDGLVYLADGPGGFRILDFGPEYGGERAAPPLLVDVDARAGRRDRVRAKKRRLQVAVLSSAGFSAAEIDSASLTFGPAGVSPTGRVRLRDVDRDGRADLVASFPFADAGLASGPVDACVEGRLGDGCPFVGCDDVSVR